MSTPNIKVTKLKMTADSLELTYNKYKPLTNEIFKDTISKYTEQNTIDTYGSIETWDVSQVTDMSSIFFSAKAFNRNIGGWNTSAVTDMSYMFWGAEVFNQDIGNWNTGVVTNMSHMFFRTYVFNQDIGNWNTGVVTNMSHMFYATKAFNQNIRGWDTSAVINMDWLFSQDEDNVSVFNQDISGWNTSAVTDMSYMFNKANKFNQYIGKWDTSIVNNMSYMFNGASEFNQNIGGWKTNTVTIMNYMFYDANKFNQDISSWSISNATIHNHFTNTGTPLYNNPCYLPNFDDISSFTKTTSITDKANLIDLISNYIKKENKDEKCTFTDSQKFYGSIKFWNTSAITDMSGTSSITEKGTTQINPFFIKTFNEDISNWDVSNVTNMSYMFYGNNAFNENISKWNTKGVTNMKSMFINTTKFNQNISKWDTSNVIDMRNMFGNASAFNQDISKWNVTKVKDACFFATTGWPDNFPAKIYFTPSFCPSYFCSSCTEKIKDNCYSCPTPTPT